MRLPRPVDAVLFDMDGVLLDTEVFYTRVTQEIVGRFGKTFDWTLKSHMVGRPALESARFLVETLGLPISPEEYLAEREAGLRALMPTADPMPGARELTEALAAAGLRLAVATSSTRRLYELKTRRHRSWFESVFDAVVLGDDPRIRAGKPAPDIFLCAAAELGLAPERCAVVEDAPAGVQAARAAGMTVVGVPYPGLDPAWLAEADIVVATLSELDAASFRAGA